MILLRAKMFERRPLDIVRDAWRVIARAAYRAVGLYWVQNILPKHFESGAGARYRYKWRTSGYRKRKDKLFAEGRPYEKHGDPVIAGSDTPLVLTGYMKREVLRSAVVRGFPTRATVYLYGPAYMTAKLSATGRARGDFSRAQPDKPAEITKVTPDEVVVLNRVLRDAFADGIKQYRGQRVTE